MLVQFGVPHLLCATCTVTMIFRDGSPGDSSQLHCALAPPGRPPKAGFISRPKGLSSVWYSPSHWVCSSSSGGQHTHKMGFYKKYCPTWSRSYVVTWSRLSHMSHLVTWSHLAYMLVRGHIYSTCRQMVIFIGHVETCSDLFSSFKQSSLYHVSFLSNLVPSLSYLLSSLSIILTPGVWYMSINI